MLKMPTDYQELTRAKNLPFSVAYLAPKRKRLSNLDF